MAGQEGCQRFQHLRQGEIVEGKVEGAGVRLDREVVEEEICHALSPGVFSFASGVALTSRLKTAAAAGANVAGSIVHPRIRPAKPPDCT